MSRIEILHKFQPIFILLKAYNVNNFSALNRRSLSPAIQVTYSLLEIVALIIFFVLWSWNVIENIVDMSKLIVSVPLLCGIFWVLSIAADIIWNKSKIFKSIDCIENTINQRQLFNAID